MSIISIFFFFPPFFFPLPFGQYNVNSFLLILNPIIKFPIQNKKIVITDAVAQSDPRGERSWVWDLKYLGHNSSNGTKEDRLIIIRWWNGNASCLVVEFDGIEAAGRGWTGGWWTEVPAPNAQWRLRLGGTLAHALYLLIDVFAEANLNPHTVANHQPLDLDQRAFCEVLLRGGQKMGWITLSRLWDIPTPNDLSMRCIKEQSTCTYQSPVLTSNML